MPRTITMPQQSDTMTEGVLVKWLKDEGDPYNEGDIVAEIETDKATMEMEGPDEPGTVAAILVKEGQKVPVGGTLAVIAVEGEDPAEVKKGAGGASAKAEGSKAEPKAQKKAQAEQEDPKPSTATATAERPSASGNGQTRKPANVDYGGPRQVEMEMPAADGNGHGGGDGRVKASPLARRIAQQKGIDLEQVKGTGPGGRIVQGDVLKFDPSRAPAKAGPAADKGTAAPKRSAPALPPRVATGKSEVVELTKMRQAIAKRLQQSKQTIPHFYETVDIELDAVERLRARLNETLEAEGIRVSLGDLIAKAVASTLKAYPVLNSTYDGERLIRHGDVHLGMAVALDNGLIVPVLRNIDQMGIREIRLRSKDLVDRARAQKLKQDEMSGATFSVSNLGGFGVREFSAIINPPEVGILAIGAGQKRAVVAEDGSIVARTIMSVTLSADHRVVDGADSARWLAILKQMLEEPGMMLV